MNKNKLIAECNNLYFDIDSCIDELLKARISHDTEAEGKALFRMESLMVGTQQNLSWIVDQLSKEELPEGLDKAAEEHAKECLALKFLTTDPKLIKSDVIHTFKAGAKWMAEQGITVNGDIAGDWRNHEDAPYDIYAVSDSLPLNGEIKYGDKVIVQIRKTK